VEPSGLLNDPWGLKHDMAKEQLKERLLAGYLGGNPPAAAEEELKQRLLAPETV
jgi:hypothetical protein